MASSTAGVASLRGCLDDEQVLLLLEGRLSESARAPVEAHLDACETCRRLVGAAALTPDGSANGTQVKTPNIGSDAPPSKPLAAAPVRALGRGDSLGRYLVLSLIGKGGMGEVYAAYDPELDRRVAIKLLHTSRGSDGARRLLEREARALGKLSHPNVVQVHDVGEHEGDVFVAMELLEGQSFDQWCRRSPAPRWQEVLAAYLDAARGLSAAHAKGLVHRDVKPSNILRGHDGRVCVADFGLAAGNEAEVVAPGGAPAPASADGATLSAETMPASAENPGGALRTAAGTVLGTPLYLAPEQHAGSRATTASDQYSFCVALYQGLYGAPPFKRAKSALLREMLAQLLVAKAAGPPSAPPAESPVPAWIHRALARGLAVAPDDRYPSMDALIAALSDDPKARRRALYRRAGVGVAAAALLAVAAAGWARSDAFRDPCEHPERELAGVWDEGVRGRVQAALLGTHRSYAEEAAPRVVARLDRYAAEWSAMRRDVCVAARGSEPRRELLGLRDACLDRRRGQLQALTTLLAEKADGDVLDHAVTAAAGLYPIAYCADTEALTARVRPPEDPAVRARVAELLPRVDRLGALYKAGKYRDGLSFGEPLLLETEALPYAPLRAEILYRMGQLRDATGDYENAKTLLREAAVSAAEGRDEALVEYAWAMLLFVVGEHQVHLEETAVIEGLGRMVVARSQDEIAQASWMNAAGLALQHLGKLAEARDMHERALAIRQRVQDPIHPDIAAGLNNLGNVLIDLGDYPHALADYQRALAIQDKALGPDHPSVASPLYNLGDLLDRTGSYALSVSMHERALAIREKALGPDHASVAPSLVNLALVLFHQGDYPRARTLFERALAIKERTLKPDSYGIAYALSGLGRVEVRLGQLDQALPLLERARALQEKGQGPTHHDVAEPLLGLGELDLARGKPEDALPLLERALSLHDPELTPEIQLTLAEALARMGRDRPRARTLATEARTAYEHLGHAPGIERASRWLAEHPAK